MSQVGVCGFGGGFASRGETAIAGDDAGRVKPTNAPTFPGEQPISNPVAFKIC